MGSRKLAALLSPGARPLSRQQHSQSVRGAVSAGGGPQISCAFVTPLSEQQMPPGRLLERTNAGRASSVREASWLAAGVRFELTDRLATVSGFQDRPVRPLRHPAVRDSVAGR